MKRTRWLDVAMGLIYIAVGYWYCYHFSPTWKEDARKARAFDSVMVVPESAAAHRAMWNKKVYYVAPTDVSDRNYAASAACFGLTGLGAVLVKQPGKADYVVSQAPDKDGGTDIKFCDGHGRLLKTARVHSEDEGHLAGTQFAFDLADAARMKK